MRATEGRVIVQDKSKQNSQSMKFYSNALANYEIVYQVIKVTAYLLLTCQHYYTAGNMGVATYLRFCGLPKIPQTIHLNH